MTSAGCKRAAVFLGFLAVLFALISWKVAWNATYAKWDVRDARLGLNRIEALRYEALHSDPSKAASCLKEIATCYSPWNWKRPDLHLGPLVESHRQAAIRDVVEYLQTKTGKNLGAAAEEWIEALKTGPPEHKDQ